MRKLLTIIAITALFASQLPARAQDSDAALAIIIPGGAEGLRPSLPPATILP